MLNYQQLIVTSGIDLLPSTARYIKLSEEEPTQTVTLLVNSKLSWFYMKSGRLRGMVFTQNKAFQNNLFKENIRTRLCGQSKRTTTQQHIYGVSVVWTFSWTGKRSFKKQMLNTDTDKFVLQKSIISDKEYNFSLIKNLGICATSKDRTVKKRRVPSLLLST